jgi:hypothetical protein
LYQVGRKTGFCRETRYIRGQCDVFLQGIVSFFRILAAQTILIDSPAKNIGFCNFGTLSKMHRGAQWKLFLHYVIADV